MKALKIIAIIIVALVLGMVIFLPNTFDVKKSITIDAPVEVVFEQIVDLKKWEAWSPWRKLDSNMIITYGEKTKGQGASNSWASEEMMVGNGSMTLIEVIENKKIVTEINFEGDPGLAWFDFEENDGKTTVHWLMHDEYGSFDLMKKLMGVLIGPMLEEQYDIGLAGIKSISEAVPKIPYSVTISEEEMQEQLIVSIIDSCSTDGEEISSAFGKAYGEIMQFLLENNTQVMGMPLSIAHKWEPENNKYVFEAGMPIANDKLKSSGNINVRILAGGKFVVAKQFGPYSETEKSYNAILAYMKEHNIEPGDMPFEVYANDPTKVLSPADIMTIIYFPIK